MHLVKGAVLAESIFIRKYLIMKTVTERSEILPTIGEIFREHGFEGASFAIISSRTGLGKGSLYHFFPGGKKDMAEAIISHVDDWFEQAIFHGLRTNPDPVQSIHAMFDGVETYFRGGTRMCLLGVLAINGDRDLFADRIQQYFSRWIDALAIALGRVGFAEEDAQMIAIDVVISIEGALLISRGLQQEAIFAQVLRRLRARCLPVATMAVA
jgi:TetR/AcrR family transcriptional repressor of lmrAB and yxaGH operons